jgi:CIC family chloride channel protein
VGKLSNAPVNTLWLYLILGMIFGCVGPLFNTWCCAPGYVPAHPRRQHKKWVLIGG